VSHLKIKSLNHANSFVYGLSAQRKYTDRPELGEENYIVMIYMNYTWRWNEEELENEICSTHGDDEGVHNYYQRKV
jgi:hypothetical protein